MALHLGYVASYYPSPHRHHDTIGGGGLPLGRGWTCQGPGAQQVSPWHLRLMSWEEQRPVCSRLRGPGVTTCHHCLPGKREPVTQRRLVPEEEMMAVQGL